MIQRLSKKDVKYFLERTFPEYKGRTFFLYVTQTYHLHNYWEGGTRSYAKAINQAGNIVSLPDKFDHPGQNRNWTIPDDVMVVSCDTFCGHSGGVTFWISPSSLFLPKLLKEGE